MRKRAATVQDVSAWILRAGVVLSVSIMLTGITVSSLHNRVSVERMEHARFDYQLPVLMQGLSEGRGKAIIEVGVYLLVFTPIMRVLASMIRFLEKRDWLYALITSLVLMLTLAGLFFLS